MIPDRGAGQHTQSAESKVAKRCSPTKGGVVGEIANIFTNTNTDKRDRKRQLLSWTTAQQKNKRRTLDI